VTARNGNTLCAIFLLSLSCSAAQHGTAESGYYPLAYHGDVFTGVVTSANDDRREITLSYTDSGSGKKESFVGVLQEAYAVKLKDGTLHELKPSELKTGALIKVYYTVKPKAGSKKSDVNTVFLVSGSPNARVRYFYFKAF
jgi:hypothetical protein